MYDLHVPVINFNWMFALIPFIFDSINNHFQRVYPSGGPKTKFTLICFIWNFNFLFECVHRWDRESIFTMRMLQRTERWRRPIIQEIYVQLWLFSHPFRMQVTSSSSIFCFNCSIEYENNSCTLHTHKNHIGHLNILLLHKEA